jgi:hypothetical protein
MRNQTLTKTLRVSLIPACLLSTSLFLSGCGSDEGAPPGKTGAAPETPSKPSSNYMKDMEKAAAEQAKKKTN